MTGSCDGENLLTCSCSVQAYRPNMAPADSDRHHAELLPRVLLYHASLSVTPVDLPTKTDSFSLDFSGRLR